MIPIRQISKFGTNYRIMPILGGFKSNQKVELFSTHKHDIFHI